VPPCARMTRTVFYSYANNNPFRVPLSACVYVCHGMPWLRPVVVCARCRSKTRGMLKIKSL